MSHFFKFILHHFWGFIKWNYRKETPHLISTFCHIADSSCCLPLLLVIFAVFFFFLLIVCFRVPQQEVENFKKLNVISQDEFETLAPKMPVDQNQEVPPLPMPGGFYETAVKSVLHQPSSFLFAAFCILFLFYCSWIDTVNGFSS